MKKSDRHEAIRARAQRAIENMYHNATPNYPRHDELNGRTERYFQEWFEQAAEFEIDYLSSGGAYGKDYRETLNAECNAGQYKSEAARRYYVQKGMREMIDERNDCGTLTGWCVLELEAGNIKTARKLAPLFKVATTPGGSGVRLGVSLCQRVLRASSRNDAMWEYISDYGKLYQHGRGGRTLAPDGLWDSGGIGHRQKIDVSELSMSACVRLIQVVESFNRVVGFWCRSVPDMWHEHCKEIDEEKLAEKRRRAAAKAKETRERNYWAARDVITI